MKKVISIIVFISILFLPITRAEAIDFSGMSYGELISLRQLIDSEIRSRIDLDDYALYPGKYYVGREILPGNYLFTALSSKHTYVNVDFYKMNEDGEYKYVERRSIDIDESGEYICLEDGYYFDILFGTITINQIDISWLKTLNQ